MKTLITYSKESDFCPVAFALKAIEGKWKLPVLWVLTQNGTLRYNELRRAVEGITNMMLTSTLKELEKDGLITRTQYNEIPPHVDYCLSEAGLKLLPVLDALAKWGTSLVSKNP